MTKQQRDDLNFLHGQIDALYFIVPKEFQGLLESIVTQFESLKTALIESD